MVHTRDIHVQPSLCSVVKHAYPMHQSRGSLIGTKRIRVPTGEAGLGGSELGKRWNSVPSAPCCVPRDFPGYVNLAVVLTARGNRDTIGVCTCGITLLPSPQNMGFCLSGRSASGVLCSLPCFACGVETMALRRHSQDTGAALKPPWRRPDALSTALEILLLQHFFVIVKQAPSATSDAILRG